MVELLLIELRKFWRAVTSAVSLAVFEVMNFVRSGQEKVVAVEEAFEASVVEAVVVAVELAVKAGPCVVLPPNELPVVWLYTV